MAPRRLVLGLLLIALAVVAVFWPSGGARVLLATLGLCAAGRGVLLLRSTAAETERETETSTRPVGTAAVVAGATALVIAALSAPLTGWVLLVAVPLLLLAASLALIGREGVARRGGQALLVWTALVAALLTASGFAQGWERAAGVATVIGALGVAVLAVPVLVSGANTPAARPVPQRPSACAGCACGAAGCGLAG